MTQSRRSEIAAAADARHARTHSLWPHACWELMTRPEQVELEERFYAQAQPVRQRFVEMVRAEVEGKDGTNN